ncbi:hypothetical protein A3712_13875 [Vibrio sp. HI00D65]|nr:hypothetical protein A3712_13875 [Vibrio sp. HI00D65]
MAKGSTNRNKLRSIQASNFNFLTQVSGGSKGLFAETLTTIFSNSTFRSYRKHFASSLDQQSI